MSESSRSKAIAAAVALAEWVKDREATGEIERYIRVGKLNKSVVAGELGFARSAWQTNPRLAEIADRLDRKWGTPKGGRYTEASQLMQAYIDRHDAQNKILPNRSGALMLVQIIDEARVSRNNFAQDTAVRELLNEYADARGLSLTLPGYIAPDEESRGRTLQDPSEMVPVKKLRDVQSRVSQLEKKIADLRASNAALRADKLRTKAIEELIARGGRISPSEIKGDY